MKFRQVYGQVNKGKTPETALVAGKGQEESSKEIAESVVLRVIKQLIAGKMTRTRTKDHTWWKPKVLRKKVKQQILQVQQDQQQLQQHQLLLQVLKDQNLFCNYCKKENHTEDRCLKKQRDQGALIQQVVHQMSGVAIVHSLF